MAGAFFGTSIASTKTMEDWRYDRLRDFISERLHDLGDRISSCTTSGRTDLRIRIGELEGVMTEIHILDEEYSLREKTSEPATR